MSCIEGANYPRQSKPLMPNVVSHIVNYADRLRSLMSDIWNPLHTSYKSQYLRQPQRLLPHDRQVLQQFSDSFLGDAYNHFTAGNLETLGFHLLKSMEFGNCRNTVFQNLQDMYVHESTPIVYNFMNSFPIKCTPIYQQIDANCKLENCDRKRTAQSSGVSYLKLFETTTKAMISTGKKMPTVAVIVESNNNQPLEDKKRSVMSVCMGVTEFFLPLTTVDEKCVKMNQELVNRKCKKINKKSKKRRRRQKKPGLLELEEMDQKPNSCKEDQVNDQSQSSCYEKETMCGNVNIMVNVTEKQASISSVSFILGHVESDSQDDWDCEDDWNSENCSIPMTDITLEFPDLLTNNLSSLCIGSTSTCYINVIDIKGMSPKLLEINRKWQKMMNNINSSEKVSTKVSFCEDNLATVFPVEMYDRKGEWEIYARERAYFKRRIERTNEILSPVLTPSHRQKIYHRLVDGPAE